MRSELVSGLAPFASLDDPWEDYPTGREALDQEIVMEAERLRRRFGP